MDRYLKNGYTIKLDDTGEYTIGELIGEGSSCVVYKACFTASDGSVTEHLLKEYNPKRLLITRGEDGTLTPAAVDAEDYEKGMERFIGGYERQLRIRRINKLKNTTSNIQRIFEKNGTRYIDMTLFYGTVYSNIREKSLFDLFRRIKAVTSVIGEYHNASLLHLDIKPDNIFTIPETCELVMMFDFDTVIDKSEAFRSGGSYTMNWAAPEQMISWKRKEICEATDLFAIGEMVFFQIFGRHSEDTERRVFSEYRFDHDSEILRSVSPLVFNLLTELFHKTICANVKRRYQSAEELISMLDRLIGVTDPRIPALANSDISAMPFFVGRKRETEQMREILLQKKKLFLTGVGGIGKSELAKNYADIFSSAYDTVCFGICSVGIKEMFINDNAVHITNVSLYSDESIDDYYIRKLNIFRELANERVLLIIDNLENENDGALSDTMSLDCHVIVTTRLELSEFGFESLYVDTLSDRNELLSVFFKNYGKELPRDLETVTEIIDTVDSHTLAIELIAKQMRAGRLPPGEMLEKLRGGLRNTGRERVRVVKDRELKTGSAYDYICAMFDISGLSETERRIMTNMSLIPPSGVNDRLFRDWCALDGFDEINALVFKGFIRENREKQSISLHPLIAEAASEELARGGDVCGDMLIAAADTLNNHFDENFDINISAEQRKEMAVLFVGISEKIIKLKVESAAAAKILNDTPTLARFYGYHNESLKYRLAGLEIRRNVLGENSVETGESYSDLGLIYKQNSDTENAEKAYLKAKEIFEGADSREAVKLAGELYIKLGSLFSDKGEKETAEEYYLKAIEYRKKYYGEKHHFTARANNHIAGFYRNNGDLKTAELYYEKERDILTGLYEENHPFFAELFFGLGTLNREKGNYPLAEEYFLKALDIRLKCFGENHPNTFYLFRSIGSFYSKTGKYPLAEEYLMKALTFALGYYGAESADTNVIYKHLGTLYQNTGNGNEAAVYLEKYLEYRIKRFGEQSGQAASTYHDLGVICRNIGALDKAEKYLNAALDIRLKLNGKDNQNTIYAYSALGELYMKKGEYRSAKELFEEALDRRIKDLGRSNVRTALSYHRLANACKALGENKSAEEYYRTALDIYDALQGEDNESSAEIRASLKELG